MCEKSCSYCTEVRETTEKIEMVEKIPRSECVSSEDGECLMKAKEALSAEKAKLCTEKKVGKKSGLEEKEGEKQARSAGKEGKKEARSAGKEGKKEGKNKELGRRGEEAAARFFERRGYEILEQNWTCSAGEADIIALDEDTLVFAEVKTRTSTDKGFPSEAVDAVKRDRYERIAALYLRDYPVCDTAVRFDIVSILVVGPDRALIRHHVNAFGC